jgi:hypothetical protein
LGTTTPPPCTPHFWERGRPAFRRSVREKFLKLGFGVVAVDESGIHAARVQQELSRRYVAALELLEAADPDVARVVSLYVGALRSECASRRIEAREYRVLLGAEGRSYV